MKTFTFYQVSNSNANFCVKFLHEEDAKKAAKDNGIFGLDASISEVNVSVFVNYDEFVKDREERLRTMNPELYQVLNKLSDDEIRILKKNNLQNWC